MTIYLQIQAMLPELQKWRHHIHQNPETAFEEAKTSQFVQEKLKSFGITIHTGFAKTGVIGVLQKGTSDRKLGFRADMDALPIEETGDCTYKSTNGKMHACGHDGHTTILLGVAKYLAQHGKFDGTVYLYFQPAEENGGGANIMIQEGAFEKFKPDEVYALHNFPSIDVGKIGCREGAQMAAPDIFSIEIKGVGGHAALPHLCNDPITVAMLLGTSLQRIVARQVNPTDSAVLSITQINAGDIFNVIPEFATLKGTVRTINPKTQDLIEEQMNKTTTSFANQYDIDIQLKYERYYPATINDPQATEYARQACKKALGDENVVEAPLLMGGEDFSYMLQQAPGCMVLLGNGNTKGLHHPEYDFNDDALPYGIQWFVNLAEMRLSQ